MELALPWCRDLHLGRQNALDLDRRYLDCRYLAGRRSRSRPGFAQGWMALFQRAQQSLCGARRTDRNPAWTRRVLRAQVLGISPLPCGKREARRQRMRYSAHPVLYLNLIRMPGPISKQEVRGGKTLASTCMHGCRPTSQPLPARLVLVLPRASPQGRVPRRVLLEALPST